MPTAAQGVETQAPENNVVSAVQIAAHTRFEHRTFLSDNVGI